MTPLYILMQRLVYIAYYLSVLFGMCNFFAICNQRIMFIANRAFIHISENYLNIKVCILT